MPPITKILTENEYLFELDNKLNEEVSEYQENKSLYELADILEVIFAICEARGYQIEELLQVKNEKNYKCGGFKDKIFLIKKIEWFIKYSKK